jgi:phosphonate transport system ATP-binding protein
VSVPGPWRGGPVSVDDVAACELHDVTVVYGNRTIVGPVSVRIASGEAVALVGPSGAGKTTLLRVLAGQVRPTDGQLWLVGLVPQRLDLIPQLTVKHNVQAGALGRWGTLRALAALVLPLEHPPARDAVARMGLSELYHQRVADLSGGEQQRVAVARLLVQDPALVLADEPVASLDPALADDVLALLRDLARERDHTLVASLHAPDLARRHFDRIIGLREGCVVFDLPPRKVTADVLDALYRSSATASSPPVGAFEDAAERWSVG